MLTGLETGTFVRQGRFGPKRNSVLPRFMYLAWSAIFRDDGVLREDADANAVACLNQLLAVFTKLDGAHTAESEVKVINNFISTEMELATTTLDFDAPLVHSQQPLEWILDKASKLCRKVLARENPREIHPKHGSGACANGLSVHKRYAQFRYIPSIDKLWPYAEFWFASPNHLVDELDKLVLSEVYEPQAKVVLVPKDVRGPRLISCEPSETMWIQQGLMQKLYDCIESHRLTRKSVHFTDQRHNQVAAFDGSIYRECATLDLSDASDRLRLDVATYLLPPNWAEAICACRSKSTKLPDGTVVDLVKHAPMGSALCFPIMALTIWSVLTAALPPGSRILVYGDDIVVPTDCYPLACEVLERIHLKVNAHKSYAKGFFRESCGKEYYRGIDITPVRLRTMPTNDMRARAATIAFANNMALRYGPQDWIIQLVRDWYRDVPEDCFYTRRDELVRAKLNLDAMTVSWNSPGAVVLCTILFVGIPSNDHIRTRWSSRYQIREFRYLRPNAVECKNSIDDWCSLFRALVNPKRGSLGSDALPKRVRYKYGWAPL